MMKINVVRQLSGFSNLKKKVPSNTSSSLAAAEPMLVRYYGRHGLCARVLGRPKLRCRFIMDIKLVKSHSAWSRDFVDGAKLAKSKTGRARSLPSAPTTCSLESS